MIYELTSTVRTADGNDFQTYGIKGSTVFFEDVSTDKTTVQEMINRINREQLEEKHLMYFIEDELNK